MVLINGSSGHVYVRHSSVSLEYFLSTHGGNASFQSDGSNSFVFFLEPLSLNKLSDELARHVCLVFEVTVVRLKIGMILSISFLYTVKMCSLTCRGSNGPCAWNSNLLYFSASLSVFHVTNGGKSTDTNCSIVDLGVVRLF